jgi:GT2 family glycosyltransferase
MNTIPVLGIPHYNRPDLLARCIASIDYPVTLLVIINNGPAVVSLDSILANEHIKNFHIIDHPNAGVAGSWNEIIKLFPAPWWMISNNDIMFGPGDLEKMAREADTLTGDWPVMQEFNEAMHRVGKLYGNHGASFFVITAYGVDKVGLFDENIYPAYLEDCDWSRRADLLGVTRVNVPDVDATHGKGNISGSSTVNSDPTLAKENARTHGGNFAYYERKWGGRNEHEIFPTPFNDPLWPVWSWRFETATRFIQQWKL